MDNLPAVGDVLHVNQDLELHLLDKLGAGGCGAVFKAERVTQSRENGSVVHADTCVVATKIFPSRYAEDAVLRKRFFTEGEFGKRVDHTNVVRTYDCLIAHHGQDVFPVLNMRFFESFPLAHVMFLLLNEVDQHDEALRHLQVCDLALLMSLVGEGLQAIHKRDIIHYDIKPGNIVYSLSDGHPRLCDLGISMPVDHMIQNAITGSTFYIAPELVTHVLDKGPAADGRADIYGLGVTMMQMLGIVPDDFRELSPVECSLANEQLLSATRLAPGDFGEILLRCVHKDPNRRFPDSFALTEALSSFAFADAKGRGRMRTEILADVLSAYETEQVRCTDGDLVETVRSKV
jgi:serine/threonine-protein kinase